VARRPRRPPTTEPGRSTAVALAVLLLGLGVGAARAQPAPEVVATGIPRPLQVALDGRTLIVLSPGLQGDSAGELYRIDLAGELPVDLARQPRVRIPFADTRPAVLGSLALHPDGRQLFLGEENGRRIYWLGAGDRLTLYATGLHRLPGGSTIAFDASGRLLALDYVDRGLAPAEERPPPGLEALTDDDYAGPLVFRLSLTADIVLPRRLDRMLPIFPRGSGGRPGGALLPRIISLTPLATGDIALLSSAGEVFRLTSDGVLGPLARLPAGQGMYNRTNMAPAPDGSVFIAGGFHVARIFRVAADGRITTVAAGLADPEGLVLDADGYLYVAESSLHRVVRLKVR